MRIPTFPFITIILALAALPALAAPLPTADVVLAVIPGGSGAGAGSRVGSLSAQLDRRANTADKDYKRKYRFPDSNPRSSGQRLADQHGGTAPKAKSTGPAQKRLDENLKSLNKQRQAERLQAQEAARLKKEAEPGFMERVMKFFAKAPAEVKL